MAGMGISSVGSSIIGPLTKTKPVRGLCNYFNKDFKKALALTTMGSIVAKDGIGCAMYVYQSMNNKEIPEKRRNFVAALDLTNGLLMIAAQIGMFFAMKKFNETLFPKMFSKTFDKAAKVLKPITEQARVNMKKAGFKLPKKFVFAQNYNAIKKGCFDTFTFITELAAATIVGKRIIVPFIATPLAQKVEKKMNAKHPLEETKNDEPKDKSNPSMTGNVSTVKQPSAVQSTTSSANTNLLAKYKK